jgi:hypothetical protein
MRRLLRDHGLSISMFGLFFVFVCGQSVMGPPRLQQHPGGARASTGWLRPVPGKRRLHRGRLRELGERVPADGPLRVAHRLSLPEGFCGIQRSRFAARQDATLPEASSKSFWLHGSAWELPTFENAEVFVDRLIRQGILVRDPVVEAAIQGHTPDMSIRSMQYRFLQATGLTHKTIQQIERARSAVSLLERGTAISDTAFELGYFDQAHLSNSLKRFVGRTPAQIAQKSTVG